MFILQNPGRRRTGIKNLPGITNKKLSCTGRGSILRLPVELVGYDFDEDIYTTNAVKCCTTDNKVSKEMSQNCRPFLQEEIERIKPKKIAVFGNKARKSIEALDIDNDDVEIRYFPHYSYVTVYKQTLLSDWMLDIASFLLS